MIGKLVKLLGSPLIKLVKAWISQWQELHLTVITYWEGSRGFRWRYSYYRKRLAHLGSGVIINVGVRIECPSSIYIGDRVHLDRFCQLVGGPPTLDLSHRDVQTVRNGEGSISLGILRIGDDCHISQYSLVVAYGGVRIGSRVTLSAGVKIYSLSSLPDSPIHPGEWSSVQPYSGSSPTVIGSVILCDNSWLGLDVLVFPGVTIGKDSFVRSRSLVTKSCPPNSFLAGDPAKYVKARFSRLKESEEVVKQ